MTSIVPHQSLDYLSPMQYHTNYQKVLPMFSSSARACQFDKTWKNAILRAYNISDVIHMGR